MLSQRGRDGGERVVNDLTTREQRAVRTALRFLRLRVGAWSPLGAAMVRGVESGHWIIERLMEATANHLDLSREHAGRL